MSELAPAGPPPVPAHSKFPTDETVARSQWELTNPLPGGSAEDTARAWMESIRQNPAGDEVREDDEFTLRSQIISVFGRGANREDLPPHEVRRVVRRLEWLGVLVTPEPTEAEDHERELEYAQKLNQAREFSDDFVHLIWKDALADNEAWDKEQERIYLEGERVRLHHEATHDALTGLLNRRGLREALDKLIAQVREGELAGLALLYIDLDEFKRVNDTLGHDAGDELLHDVADEIEGNSRKPDRGRAADVVARPLQECVGEEDDDLHTENSRTGGDEFVRVIVFEHPPTKVHPVHGPGMATETQIEEKMLAAIAGRDTARLDSFLKSWAKDHIPGGIDRIGASVGYVLLEPDMDADEFMRQGDMHMYAIKYAKKAALEKGVKARLRRGFATMRKYLFSS